MRDDPFRLTKLRDLGVNHGEIQLARWHRRDTDRKKVEVMSRNRPSLLRVILGHTVLMRRNEYAGWEIEKIYVPYKWPWKYGRL